MKKLLVPDKKTILFIDTGDNCRCPMAAGYFLKLLEQRGIKHIDIKTAGVMTPTGLLPTPEAVLLLHEEGVDIRRHRSRPLSPELIKRSDLILGMTPFHVQSAYRMAEEARGKTFLMKEYVGREGRNTQIADPMGGTLEIFKKCFSEIKASLQRLVEMDFVTKVPEPREVMVDTTPQPKPGAEEKKPERPKRPAVEKAATESKPAAKAKPAKASGKTSKPAKSAKSATGNKAAAKSKATTAKSSPSKQVVKGKPKSVAVKASGKTVARKPTKPAPAKKTAKPVKAAAKSSAAKTKSGSKTAAKPTKAKNKK